MVEKEGLATQVEMGEHCCYAKQDKFWAMNPDGYRWEVYYFHEDVEWNDLQDSKKRKNCCSPAMLVESENKEVSCCNSEEGCEI